MSIATTTIHHQLLQRTRWFLLTCGRCISMPTEAHIAFHVSTLRLSLRVSTTEKTRSLADASSGSVACRC